MIEAAARKLHRSTTEATTEAAPEAAMEVEEHLGPAEVVEVRTGEIVVQLAGGARVRVAPAFAVPYTPAVKDVLLVVGRGPSHYAIGVLRGSGRADLVLEGDVTLRAVNGKLSLHGDRGIDVRGPEVDVFASALRMVARDVHQKFESVCERVTSLLRVHAGEAQTIVDGGSLTTAKSASILSEETVCINGREVHLG
jgi:hypothetical protein